MYIILIWKSGNLLMDMKIIKYLIMGMLKISKRIRCKKIALIVMVITVLIYTTTEKEQLQRFID